jgi:23S rRNA pseudouridine2457 synthase
MYTQRFNYYKIFKPYGMVSQFSESGNRPTLKSLSGFPKNVYPVGRLDADSEGLLLLTDDKSLTDHLLNPAYNHEREYLVQVEGIPRKDDLEKLKSGVVIKGIRTKPAFADLINIPSLPQRVPPIRFRKNIPDCWLRIILTEGKNRQVRRMTAAIGFPALRLVRVRIENITLGKLNPAEVDSLSQQEIDLLLKKTEQMH